MAMSRRQVRCCPALRSALLLERKAALPYIRRFAGCACLIPMEIAVSRKPLLVIFVTVFVDLLGFGIVLPLLPRYAEHFLPVTEQVQEEQAAQAPQDRIDSDLQNAVAEKPKRPRAEGLILGCLMASFSAMQFLFAPLWGMISDRVGRRPVLLIGLAGSTFFYALFAMVTQWGNSGPILGYSPLVWLFVTRIGAGIAGATIPTAQAYIADTTDENSRGRGMALIGAAFGIGFTFGPLLGSMFVPNEMNAAPSPAPGYVAAVLSGLAFLFGLTSLPESLKRDDATKSASHGWLKMGATLRVVTHRTLGPIVLAVFLTTFAFAQFETTLAMLTKRIGVADRGNFYIFSYIGLILTVAQGVLVRRLIGRLGEFRMSMLGVVLMTIGLIMIGFTARTSSVWMLVAVLPVAVIGFAATTPSLQSMLSLSSGGDEQGEVLGVGQSISALARIGGPVSGLILQDRELALPYWAGAGLMALSLLLVWRLRGIATTSHSHAAPTTSH